jgi:Secretion system C-terminal sorting domain
MSCPSWLKPKNKVQEPTTQTDISKQISNKFSLLREGNFENAEIIVCDALGVKITGFTSVQVNTWKIDVTKLRSGIYFVKIKSASGLLTKKIVIRH